MNPYSGGSSSSSAPSVASSGRLVPVEFEGDIYRNNLPLRTWLTVWVQRNAANNVTRAQVVYVNKFRSLVKICDLLSERRVLVKHLGLHPTVLEGRSMLTYFKLGSTQKRNRRRSTRALYCSYVCTISSHQVRPKSTGAHVHVRKLLCLPHIPGRNLCSIRSTTGTAGMRMIDVGWGCSRTADGSDRQMGLMCI